VAWFLALHDLIYPVLLLASEVFCPWRGFVESEVIRFALSGSLFGLVGRQLEGGVIASGKSGFYLDSIYNEQCRRAGRL